MEKKPVPGFEDRYYLDPDIMRVVSKKRGRPLAIRKDGDGYANVELWKNNKRHYRNLHVLFGRAYIPNPDNLPELNHKDEDPMNFSLDNLEWCTHKYNVNYGTANERRGKNLSAVKKGKPQPVAGHNRSIPVTVIDSYGDETTYRSGVEVDRHLGLRPGTTGRILRGEGKPIRGYTFIR